VDACGSVEACGWGIDWFSAKALAFRDTAVDGRVLSREAEFREADGDEEEDTAGGMTAVSDVGSAAGIVPAPAALRRSARR